MSAEKIPILKEKMSGEHKYCSYLLAYFKAKGLNAGDAWIAHEYQKWISNKHKQFMELIRSPCCLGYNEKQRAQFELFILQENEQRSCAK